MESIWDERPAAGEYGSFYQSYIEKLGSGNIIEILGEQQEITSSLITSLDERQALYRYKEQKWTVKEVIGHLIDTERVFAYRALSISRNDTNELPGFDQDEYVEAASFNDRSLQNFRDEYAGQRRSTIALFSSFSKEILDRKGIANNYSLSVRAIPFIIAGHERHHLEILDNRYGLEVLGE